MASDGWTLRKAHWTPVLPRVRMFVRLHRQTWKNRKRHGGVLCVLRTNFKLATWLRPTDGE